VISTFFAITLNVIVLRETDDMTLLSDVLFCLVHYPEVVAQPHIMHIAFIQIVERFKRRRL